MNLSEILQKANEILKLSNIEEGNLKSRILLSNILNKSKEYLMIHDDELVEEKYEKDFFDKLELLKDGMPIQYIINKQEFMGLEFYVDDNVLIPQPDTEILVEEILDKVKSGDKILDLCTGSGAIGISIGAIKKDYNLKLCLSDVSNFALDIARKNAKKHNVEAEFIESDLFENINDEFNIIVSNPPYIELEDIKNLSNEVKKEPFIALFGGKDGLLFYRNIALEAKKYLKPNGILGLEIGYNQKSKVIDILEKNGYKDIYSKKDLGGNDRIVICRRGN